MDSGLADLEQWIELDGGGGGSAAGGDRGSCCGTPEDLVVVDEVLADLANVIVAGDTRPTGHWQQRSWQLLEHARGCRAAKRAKKELAAVVEEASWSKRFGSIVSFFRGGSTKGLDKCLSPEQLALCTLGVAVQNRWRGSQLRRPRQAKAFAQVSSALQRVQHDCFLRVFGDDTSQRFSDPSAQPGIRVNIFCVQWDETTQRLRSLRRVFGRASSEQVSMPVMMQHCTFQQVVQSVSGLRASRVEPYFIKGAVLQTCTAEEILANILRHSPVPWDDASRLVHMTSMCDVIVFHVCVDGASVNDVVARWLFGRVQRIPRAIIHLEHCKSHVLALVKGRCRDGATLAALLNSFVRLLRNQKFKDSLHAAVVDLVCAAPPLVRFQQRPEVQATKAEELLTALFGHWRGAPDRNASADDDDSCRTQFANDASVFLRVVNLEAGALRLVHWCYVLPDSTEHLVDRKPIGAPCCASQKESTERVVQEVMRFFFGRAWRVSVVSRWLHSTTLMARFYLCLLPGGLLTRAIERVKLSWGLRDDMIALLARIVSADADDFSARSKLKLVRITRGLCAASVPHELATILVAARAVDQLHYSVLGSSHRKRATLLDLLHPEHSLIGQCIQHVCGLLSDWAPDAAAWALLFMFGEPRDIPGARETARRHTLQYLCGLFDFLELPMSRPPYSLLALCTQSLDMAARRSVCASFFSERVPCLPLMCQRLRTMFPTEVLFLHEAPRVLEPWALNTMLSIDFCERSHGGMRLAAQSSGRGRDFVPVCNKMFCSQAHAEHLSRGGQALTVAYIASRASAPPEPLPDAHEGAAHAVVPARGCRPDPRPYVGSARIRLQNMKCKTYKALYARHRPLTAAERGHITAAASREWARVRQSLVQHGSWLLANRSAAALKQLAPRTGEAPTLETRFEGLWGQSSEPRCIVDPAVLVRYGVGSVGPTSAEHGWANPSAPDEVPGLLRIRADSLATWEQVHGCFTAKRNVCRKHEVLTAVQVALLDDLTERLSAWADSLGREQVERSTNLLWLHNCACAGASASSSDPGPRDAIALLVYARWKPKVQYFVRCALEPSHAELTRRLFVVPDPPFVAWMIIGASRLGARFQSLLFQTSDELALELVVDSPGAQWALLPLEWELPPGSLLHHSVVGVKAEFVAPIRKARGAARSDVLPDVFGLPDPFAAALAPAAACGPAPPSGVAHGFGGAVDAADSEAGDASDDEAVAGLPEDIIEDLHASLLEGDPAGDHTDDVFDVIGDEKAPDADVAELGPDEPSLADAVVEPALISPEIAAARAVIDAAGYVRLECPPWNSFAIIGRITEWPADKPPVLRSVSMRCYVHAGCKAAKLRRKVDDAQLMRWLFSGVIPEPGSTDARKKELRAAHMALFKEMVP